MRINHTRLATVAGAALLSLYVGAHARAGALNDVINQTNFIVANQCSGTLISLKYKLVLTNDHCLQGYVDKVEKEETGKDGTIEKKTREVYKDMELKQKAYKDFEEVSAATFQAKILFHDAKADLALLKIKADSIPQKIYSHVLPEGKPVERGDKVFIVGNPHMLDANLNEGVISSTTRMIHWDETNEDVHYYGVDGGINPGNSGGALYNVDLDLIGVPGAGIRGGSGLGFAIPAPTIRDFLKDHCYGDVWSDKADDHATCLQKKLDKENEVRVKAGLPAKEAPKDQDSLSGSAEILHMAAPAPANVTPPVKPPEAKTLSSALLGWIDSWGLITKP